MFLIEKVSSKIGHNIADYLDIDRSREEIIVYGAVIMLQTLLSILLALILGLIFNVFAEVLLVSFSGSILRKCSGGVHSASPNRCAVIGAVISTILSVAVVFAVKNISFSYFVLLIIIGLIYSYFYIYKYAPSDSEKKPIKNILKRKRLKRYSIILVTVMYTLAGYLIMFYLKNSNIIYLRYAGCITIGIVWQSFSLTKSAHNVLYKIDSFFIKSSKEV